MKASENNNDMENNALNVPPKNYAFNNLIEDFAEAITGDHVEVIKRRFEGIIPSEVQTGRQIVDYLRQNDYVSQTNIIYLQQIIRILDNPNLLQKTISFLKENRARVLHFDVKTLNIRAGFQEITIHVEGHEVFRHEDLTNLRRKISEIVLVPPEDVCFAGIEETNSFEITFVLPDMYCEALYMLLLNPKKHYHFLSLRKFGVDRIKVLGNWYEICEKASENEKNDGPLVESTNTKHEKNVQEKTDEAVESRELTWGILILQDSLHKIKSLFIYLFIYLFSNLLTR